MVDHFEQGAEIGLFSSQHLWRSICSTNDKVGAEIATFASQHVWWVGAEIALFLPVSMIVERHIFSCFPICWLTKL